MQRVFELISSVNSIVNNVKVTAKKVCRNIILTMATVISVLTVIIVSLIIDSEKEVVAGSTTEVVEVTTTEAKENMELAYNDVNSEVETTETATEATTEIVVESTTEEVTEEETTYMASAEVETKESITTTYAPVEIYYTEEDYDALLRIVHAEAGNQDEIGKILVANVIINRVKSEKFPDDIYSVITQNNGKTYQFSPVIPGHSFYSVVPTEHTKECVDRALAGEDYSKGALFFCRETSSDSWFNTKLTFLFTHGPHYFYK